MAYVAFTVSKFYRAVAASEISNISRGIAAGSRVVGALSAGALVSFTYHDGTVYIPGAAQGARQVECADFSSIISDNLQDGSMCCP